MNPRFMTFSKRYIFGNANGILAFIFLLMSCSTKNDNPVKNGPEIIGNIELNDSGRVITPFSISDGSGSQLTIGSGTSILMLDENKFFQPINAGSKVEIVLSKQDTTGFAVPTDSRFVASFSITALVNGKSAELLFIPSQPSSIVTPPNASVRWSSTINDTAIHAGSIVNFYKISSTGSLVPFSSTSVGFPASSGLGKRAGTSPNGMPVYASPNGTGKYGAATSDGPATSSQSAIPSGLYWTTYSPIPNNKTVDIAGVSVGGPLYLKRVIIGEPSTTELLAEFNFKPGVNCLSWEHPIRGDTYWAERTQDAEGKTTFLKIAANVANIPYVNLELYSIEDNLPIWLVCGMPADGGCVHTPEGSVLTNPYEESSRKFGGTKVLSFENTTSNKGIAIKNKVQGAGYETSSFRFDHGITTFDVVLTLDGRKKLEETVLRKNHWVPTKDNSVTHGNVGLYHYCDSITLDVTTHSAVQSVNNKRVTLAGTIENPSGDIDPVTDVLITCMPFGGGDSLTTHATVENDGTTFTASFDLFPGGANAIIIRPIGKDLDGKTKYFWPYQLLAKGTKTTGLQLTYDPAWTATFTVTAITTTKTNAPYESEGTSTRTISGNLDMDFAEVKVRYVRESHSNAVSCAEFSNCNVFSGTNGNNSVTVSESMEMKTKGCEDKLPLVLMSSMSGQATISKYKVRVAADLTPWEAGDNSTLRKYHLSISAFPDWTISTDPNWPVSTGQAYDCVSETWKATESRTGSTISVDMQEASPVLKFDDSDVLEEFVLDPSSGKTWNFSGVTYSSDSLSVTRYTATLTVQ